MFILINYTAKQLFVRRMIHCCNKLFTYLMLQFRNSTFTTCVLLNRKKWETEYGITWPFTYLLIYLHNVAGLMTAKRKNECPGGSLLFMRTIQDDQIW